MTKPLPIIYSVPHNSINVGAYMNRIALTPEQLLRFSDYGTELTVPRNGYTVIAEYSRALGSLNQPPKSAKKFPIHDFHQPQSHNVWKKGEELTDEEKKLLIQSIHDPYYAQIQNLISNTQRDSILVDWHNTAHYIIGKDEKGKKQMMKPIILSNRGNENSSEGKKITCEPQLLEAVAKILAKELMLRNLPNEVYCNHVYKGGNIIETFNTHYNPDLHSFTVNAFQVEYDTIITHDQENLKPNEENIRKLREAFTLTMEKAVKHFLS